jgi:selenide,water dikinase
MPINVLPGDVIREILRGRSRLHAGRHPGRGRAQYRPVEPVYGLAAIGLVHPRHVKRNADAQPGDVSSSASRWGWHPFRCTQEGALAAGDYRAMIDTTTRLNVAGPDLAQLPGVHAMTDVTGFGLLGHLLEMCRGAGLSARVQMAEVPLLDNVLALADRGFVTGASARNWASYGADVRIPVEFDAVRKALLCDPQTSGGLLVACARDAVDGVLDAFRRHGCGDARAIGAMGVGAPGITVEI